MFSKEMYQVQIVFLMLLAIFTNIMLSQPSELLSVTVLYRHGSRAPRKLYKYDSYRTHVLKIWPDGLQQLTNHGKREAFALGQWYRKTYKKFIPQKYTREFIRVLSSDKDRCIMTAACVLAGLYPPEQEQTWNEYLRWQPVPIHTIPENMDGLIIAVKRPCEKYEKLYQELLQSDMYVNFLRSNKELFDYLSYQTREPIKSPFDVIDLHDVLSIEKFHNLSLPEWTKKVFPRKTLPLMTMTYALDTNTTEMGRLLSGLLLDYITTFFEDTIRNSTTSQKFLMLSGHDSTINRLMNILGVYDYSRPEYTSTLGFELRSRRKEVFIRIYFRDSKTLDEIKLPGCELDCNFEKFKKITKHFRIKEEDWVKECCQCKKQHP